MRTWWRDAIGAETPLVWPEVRRALWVLSALVALTFAWLSISRYETFHNRTFDLAFYARIAWGEAHFDGWQPIVSAPVRGLHLSWILVPLGFLGALLGQVHVLLVAQSLALAASLWPLAAIGARHGGRAGALAVALAYALHPNLSLVGGDEFHPGTVALLPLALLADALDRKSAPALVLATLGVLLCREDLGLVTALAAALFALRSAGRERKVAAGVALGSLAYVLLFMLVIHPANAPARGSLELHFGRLGSSVTDVVVNAFLHPGALIEHLAVPHRLACLPMLVVPFAFLPVLRPLAFVVAAPVLGIALLSEFPGTTAIDSHYLTPALPLLAGASGQALASLRTAVLPTLLALASASAHLALGGTPASLSFDASHHVVDDTTRAGREVVRAVGPSASVQAPETLLSHFAERADLRRAPPPESGARFVVLDVSHRRRFRHREDLLRTVEEPTARAWLAREDHALIAAAGDWLVLESGADPRGGVGFERFVVGTASPRAGRRLTDCLRLLDAREGRSDDARFLVLDLVATGACPADLALCLGEGKRPRRVDLLAGGLVPPAFLRAGDRLLSIHELEEDAQLQGFRVGALRSSGARPDHHDPRSLPIFASDPR